MTITPKIMEALQKLQDGIDSIRYLGWEVNSFQLYRGTPGEGEVDRIFIYLHRDRPDDKRE